MATMIDQSWTWVQKPVNPLEAVELAGRTCYKSENKITSGSAERFAQAIVSRGHESVLEHVSASVRFVTNRGVTHELVRHRHCAFSQESTRYVRYGAEDMEFIVPVWWDSWAPEQRNAFFRSCEEAERTYAHLLSSGASPQQAREVLPNALKTEIVVTANLREWRHIFRLRCAKAAHPQIRDLMTWCRKGFQAEIPVIFS